MKDSKIQQTKTKTYRSGINEPQLLIINDLIAARGTEFLDELGVQYSHNDKFCWGACPVHGGDNHTAFNFFLTGETSKCNWVCYTHHCERKVGRGVISLIQGVKKCNFNQAIDFISKFLGQDVRKIKADDRILQNNIYNNQMNILHKELKKPKLLLDRKVVRSHLVIPAEYYLNRGYSSAILDEYDVGLCDNQSKPLKNRIIFPVYDNEYKNVIGCVGRSIYEKHSCGYYHKATDRCPVSIDEKFNSSKWKNSPNFNTTSWLFNYWKAAPYINREGVVILVEGPGDVLKLEEAGVHNSLALFGSNISDEQMIILERSGATKIIGLTDNDDAGQLCAEQIKIQCSRLYNLSFPKFDAKDVGDLNASEVRKILEKA